MFIVRRPPLDSLFSLPFFFFLPKSHLNGDWFELDSIVLCPSSCELIAAPAEHTALLLTPGILRNSNWLPDPLWNTTRYVG